jgi:lysyl-tRNA synthetase class 1
MHWADSLAEEILKNGLKKQVVCTGTSLSGEPHLGSANDVIRGDAICKALAAKGADAKLIWIADDMDPYRSVPAGFPEQLNDYLGFPVAHIPDPWGCHKNFVYHFEEMFLGQLKKLDIEPDVHLGVDMYHSGFYDPAKIIAMEKKAEIIAILNKYREIPLTSFWWPIDVICEKCGRISTTSIKSYDPVKKEVEYVCTSGSVTLHKKNIVNGCGHHGKVSILGKNTKITWRVEWACRWQLLGVTCEPFGKEHAASGGSWDTGKELVKLFDWQPPVPVIYEFFQVEGGKMSKSKGNVITVPIMLEIMRPEELKFWMYYGKISKARELSLDMMPVHVAEEFDKAERIYLGERTDNEKDDANYSRSYELAVTKKPKRIAQVPYTFASALVQISKGREIEALKKTGHIPSDVTKEEVKRIEARLQNAANWINDYAPDEYRMKLLDKMPEEKLDAQTKELFAAAAGKIEKGIGGEELQQFIYNTAKERKMEIKKVFGSAYGLFLGRETGPRLGPFLVSLDKDFAMKRLTQKG